MTRIFDITPASDILNIDSSGQGKLLFTVTNTTGRPQRASFRLRALDSGQSSWLKLNGDMERDFTAGFTHQVEVAVAPPSGAPPGRFRVRLDALSVANPDDDFTEGPAVGVVVPATAPPPKKSMWWVWLLIGIVVLIVLGVILYLATRKPPESDSTTKPNTPPTAPAPESARPGSVVVRPPRGAEIVPNRAPTELSRPGSVVVQPPRGAVVVPKTASEPVR